MTDAITDTTGPEGSGTTPPPTGGTTPWRVVGVVIMVAIVLFWIWIFSGAASRQNPDYLSDRTWADQAEATCAATMAGVDERAAPAGRQDRAARADAIDASTDDLRVMLDELRSPLPDGEGDQEVIEPWLTDWDSLLDDRTTYAAAIRVNPDAQFLTTEKFNDPLDKVVEIFADVNDMPSCGPAGDVG